MHKLYKLQQQKLFVVDEADMTLEFGYLEDIDAVAGKMADDLQMMVFSATIPQNPKDHFKGNMQSPITIEIDRNLLQQPMLNIFYSQQSIKIVMMF